jgi:hypothetical protein
VTPSLPLEGTFFSSHDPNSKPLARTSPSPLSVGSRFQVKELPAHILLALPALLSHWSSLKCALLSVLGESTLLTTTTDLGLRLEGSCCQDPRTSFHIFQKVLRRHHSAELTDAPELTWSLSPLAHTPTGSRRALVVWILKVSSPEPVHPPPAELPAHQLSPSLWKPVGA